MEKSKYFGVMHYRDSRQIGLDFYPCPNLTQAQVLELIEDLINVAKEMEMTQLEKE